jgi:hypothetical protein
MMSHSFRPLLIIVLLLLLIGALWVWWSLPRQVDMASYAPADSFVYLEFNSLTDVTDAIQNGQTWQAIAPILGMNPGPANRIFTNAAKAGIGPTGSVIFNRSQVALVLVGMNTTEEDETLRIRPEAALLIETHTSKWRMKSTALEAVQRLASFAYGQAGCLERSDAADFVECSSPGSDRKIVAAIDGSLIVIGNTEKAVRSCLDAKRGARPSLQTDRDLQLARASLNARQSLGFGYISSNNSARLFSWAVPVLMGRVPGNGQLDQLLNTGASKILRGISWTSSVSTRGIRDRFLFSLEPAVANRLQPAFETAPHEEDFWKLIPNSYQSLTIYRSRDPLSAWTSLDAAVALKLDTVSSVIFGSLLRSGLSVYGVDDPKALLTSLKAPVVTFKPAAYNDGSVMLARITDEAKLRTTLRTETFKERNGQILETLEIDPSDKFEFTAVIVDGYLLVGKTDNVRTCVLALRNKQSVSSTSLPKQPDSSATIVTYSNDEARVKNFIAVIAQIKGPPLNPLSSHQLRLL